MEYLLNKMPCLDMYLWYFKCISVCLYRLLIIEMYCIATYKDTLFLFLSVQAFNEGLLVSLLTRLTAGVKCLF